MTLAAKFLALTTEKRALLVIARPQAVAIHHPRHCEEHSDVAIQGFMDRHAALAMTKLVCL